MKNNLLPIAKEGIIFIAYASGIFVLFYILDLEAIAILAFISLLLLGFIFRNPEREIPLFEEKSVLSPVDGSIFSIDEINTPDYAYKVTIESSFLDTAVLRAPIAGKITSILRQKGTRLSLSTDLGQKLNEFSTLVFEDTNKNQVKVSHIVSQGCFDISIYADTNKQVAKSSRYGISVHGRTEVYLPKNFRLNIHTSQKVKACESLLGYFS